MNQRRITRHIRHTVPVTHPAPARVRYRDVLGNREFAAILASQGLSITGDQIARIAVAVLVYNRTGSAFAASATYAVSYLTWLLGGPVLSSLADRYPRRTVMIVCDLGRAALIAVLLLPGLPLAVIFAVLVLVGMLAPPFDSGRSATLPDVLPGDLYVTGSLVINLVMQAAQVVGFALGGVLLATVGTSTALALDVGTFLLSAVALVAFVQRWPAAATEPSVGLLGDTRAGIAVVRQSARMRRLLAYAMVAMAIVIAPEGVAIAVSRRLDGGDIAAGLLTASVPFGFLVGGVLLVRTSAQRRESLLPVLCVISAVPLLLTPLANQVWMVVVLWAISGSGSALQIVASAAYIQAAPAAFRSRAYGVAATALMGAQGLTLLIAGLLADWIGAREAVAVLALGGLLVLPALKTPGTGRIRRAQGKHETSRKPQG